MHNFVQKNKNNEFLFLFILNVAAVLKTFKLSN